MNRLKTLLAVTDGWDNTDDSRAARSRIVTKIQIAQILFLSCGIGTIEVDHRGLQAVASAVGGYHIVIHDSRGIAQALADITTFIHGRLLALSRSSRTQQQVRAQSLGVVSFARFRLPIDLLILIDRSWSMLGLRQGEGLDGDWNGDRQKLPETKRAAKEVIRSLDPQRDRVAVASFCEDYELLTPLTSRFDACTRAIDSIRGGFGTSLYEAMCQAISDLTE